MSSRRVLTIDDYVNINITIIGLRQNIEDLQQRVDNQNNTIEELTRQLHLQCHEQVVNDPKILPVLTPPPPARSAPSPNPAPLSLPSSPRDSPSPPATPPPPPPPPPAASQSRHLTSILQRMEDVENSK